MSDPIGEDRGDASRSCPSCRGPLIVAGVLALITQINVLWLGVTVYAMDSAWLAGVSVLIAVEALRAGRPLRCAIFPLLVWLSLPIVIMIQVAQFGLQLRRWDLLWISIWFTVIVTWWFARRIPVRVHGTLVRLQNRHVLRGSAAAGDVTTALNRSARGWAIFGGIALAIGFMVTTPPSYGLSALSWLVIWPQPFRLHFWPVLALSFAIGSWMGVMAAYGRLGSTAERLGHKLRVVAGHPDRAGGLRPVGALYLYQSRVAAVPSIFIAFWLIALIWSGWTGIQARYEGFIEAYLWLLIIPILLQVLAFIVPLYSVHRAMRTARETELWHEADVLSRPIEDAHRRLAETNGSSDSRLSQFDNLARRYRDLENAPTWPLDASIRRRITLQNVALLLPLVGYVWGDPMFWQSLSDFLAGR